MRISKNFSILLLSIIFLLPLLGAYKNFGYEHIKVLFFIFSISLIGIFWTYFLFKKRIKLKWTKIKLISLFFISVLLINSFLGVDILGSLLGVSPYFQGWIVYAYLILLSLMVSSVKLGIKEVALALTLSSIFVSCLAIKQWVELNLFNIPIPTYAGRVVSTFGQPNFFAGFLLLTLPFSYLLFKNQNTKIKFLGWASGLVLILGILVSYSRLAILLTLFLLILGLIIQLKNKLVIMATVMVVLLTTLLVSYQFSLGIIGQEFVVPLKIKTPYLLTDSLEKRVYIWQILWQQFINKPLLGYGLENISLAFSSFKHTEYPELLSLVSKDLIVDRSHNYILDLLIFSGVPGALVWLILIILVLINLLKSNGQSKGVLLVGLLTYLVWIQFQNQSIVHLMYSWFLAGLID